MGFIDSMEGQSVVNGLSGNGMEDADRDKITSETYKAKGLWRYTIAILGFLAMTNSYALRSHLNITIVAMVGTRNTTMSKCGKNEEFVIGKPGEFDWSTTLQGVILGSFYYGYIVPQIAGGRLAEKYSAKWVIFSGGCLATLGTFLGPIAAKTNVGFFIFTRVMCGLGLAVFQPCLHSLIARWAPPHERSLFSAIVYSGNQFGVVLATPVAGYVDTYSGNGGWPWSFYVFGIFAAIWLILWCIFVYKEPTNHPWISSYEQKFIQNSLANAFNSKHMIPVPWKEIFKSKPVWGLIVCHFGYNWGFYTLLTEIPTYMSDKLGFSISQNGVLSCLPYLLMMIVGYASSYAAFQITKRQLISVVAVRKGLNTFAVYGSAISLITICFISCQIMATYGMLLLAVSLLGLTYAGFQVNHVDLSPNFAGTLEGITNSAASIPGIIMPYIVGVIREGEDKNKNWQIIFALAIAMLVVFGTFYLVAGSATLQSWNEPKISYDKKIIHTGSENGISILSIAILKST